MTPISTEPSKVTTVAVVGVEWCKPLPKARLLDYITIPAGEGHAVLCRIEQNVDTGTIRRVMIKESDLNKADE